jgi:hypothetical protein
MCLLAYADATPGRIALDATAVYWTEPPTGSVKKVPIHGGPATTLTSSATSLSLAVDALGAYFGTPQGLAKVPLTGGSVTALTTGTVGPIASDGITVYFAGNGLQKVSVNGGTATMLASGDITDLAIDRNNVYWVTRDAAVWKAGLAGGSPIMLVQGQASALRIAVDATNVYWTQTATSDIRKVSLSGGAAASVTLTTNQTSVGITSDGTNLYWVDGRYVQKQPIVGGPPVMLANAGGLDIAIDGTYVYWINPYSDGPSGGIMRVFK